MSSTITHDLKTGALVYHEGTRPGKLEIRATKPMSNQHEMALAYSPGVAAVSEAIHADPSLVSKYTAKANLVAVISNGTAVLGLGNIGPLAAKPVMEGKVSMAETKCARWRCKSVSVWTCNGLVPVTCLSLCHLYLFRLQPHDFFAQTVDLLLLRLYLP